MPLRVTFPRCDASAHVTAAASPAWHPWRAGVTRRLGVLLVVLLAGCPGSPSSTGRDDGSRRQAEVKARADHQYSAEEWRAEVLQSAEPVLVDFWAPWCGPCLQMNPTIDRLARDYKVRKVNIDKNPQLAERYDVSGIPLFLIFKDGKVVSRHVGVTPERTLRDELAQLSRP